MPAVSQTKKKRGRPRGLLPLKDRLWSRIDRRGPDECWLWQGAINPDGFGIFRDDKGKVVRTHRKVYELEKGPIPKGKLVLHRCDARSCCNPGHLELGTHRDSKLPMLINGRNAKARRLSDEQVLEIVKIRAEQKLPYKTIGRMFGVTGRNVSLICNGHAYAWLTKIEEAV